MEFRAGKVYRFFKRLRQPVIDAHIGHAENVLAIARVFLGISALAASYLAVEATNSSLVHWSLFFYSLESVVVLILLRMRPQLATPAFGLGIHILEICWATYITVLGTGSGSPFYPFFLFVLLGAGYRWGFLETVATACASIVALNAQGLYQYHVISGDFDPTSLAMRSAYILLMGLLAGYLAESEKIDRSSTMLVARLVEAAQVGAQLKSVLQPLSQELRRICGVRQVSLVMLELDKGETLSWHDEESHDGMAALEDLGLPEQVMRDLFYGSPRASYVERTSSNNAGSVFLIPIHLGAEAAGYLFLTDPDVGGSETVLQFLQEFFTKITPAIHNAYLVERLHSQVSREERAHLARELHDGAVQMLSVAMIEVDTLILDPSSFKAKLIRIQSHLCDAMNGLRDLSQRMRFPEVEGKQLRRVLAALVDNFSRDSGISATFICSSDEVQLPARTCHEIVRIVQEALVNVRKHSRAHNVAVRLRESEDWLMTIEDDGRGFDFSGRRHHAELDADGKGPAIIIERVRSAGGTLTIESRPGRGARLEVAFPNGF